MASFTSASPVKGINMPTMSKCENNPDMRRGTRRGKAASGVSIPCARRSSRGGIEVRAARGKDLLRRFACVLLRLCGERLAKRKQAAGGGLGLQRKRQCRLLTEHPPSADRRGCKRTRHGRKGKTSACAPGTRQQREKALPPPQCIPEKDKAPRAGRARQSRERVDSAPARRAHARMCLAGAQKQQAQRKRAKSAP